MHRPTRQHDHLLKKIETKKARSRRNGNKAKRLAKWVESYKGLCEGKDAKDAKDAS